MTGGTSAVYRPTCTGSPAIVAYAIAFGMTTAAEASPAMRSALSHAGVYVRAQTRTGIRLFNSPVVPAITDYRHRESTASGDIAQSFAGTKCFPFNDASSS